MNLVKMHFNKTKFISKDIENDHEYVKEPININALADEYLRLSYHGLRSKNKSFIVALKTDFDETSGNLNIISQDIERVLLNLYNMHFMPPMKDKN